MKVTTETSLVFAALFALAACSPQPASTHATGRASEAASEATDGLTESNGTTASENVEAAAAEAAAESEVDDVAGSDTAAAAPPDAPATHHRPGAPRTLPGLEGLSELRIASTPSAPTVPAQPTALTKLVPTDGQTTHDFGRLFEGDAAETEFVLVNAGEAPVAIETLNSSCKCTLGDLFVLDPDGTRTPYEVGQPIAPQQEVVVRAALETILQRGTMQHSVVLVLSDRTAARLVLTANVTPFLSSDPANGVLNVGVLRRDESGTASMTVRASNGEPVLLTMKEQEIPPYFHPTLTPLDPDADGRSVAWRVDVVAGPGVPEVPKRPSAFNLYSDVDMPGEVPEGKGVPTVFSQRVVVGAQVMPSVKLEPNFVSFGVFAAGTARSIAIDVEYTDDHVAERDPTVTVKWGASQVDVAALEPYLTTRVHALDEGSNWRLDVDLAELPSSFAGTFQGTLVLSLDHPERSDVIVPFSGMVRAPKASR